MNNKNKIAFLVIVLLMSFLYEYQDITFLLPQSVHHWRQSDCASFAMIYYENGMKFFEPKVYNVLMGGGNAVGECPIIYYSVACLYKIFGPHEFIFRLVCLIIFYCGLFALLQISYSFLKDKFYSFYVPILLFSSPLLMFFANNFLCDVPSLSMVFIAWSFILKYRDTQKNSHFIWGMFFFAMAGLLKANALISFVALSAMFFLEINNWIKLRGESKLFNNLKLNITGFVLVGAIVAGWYLWAIHYNEKYEVNFLGTKSWPGWPIWQASEKDFLSTTTMLFFHSTHIFHLLTCALIGFLILFVNANRAVLDKMLYGVLLLTLIGAFAFIMTFFVGFRDNIYYFVNVMIVPAFVFISSLSIMKVKYNEIFNSFVFKGLLVAFLILNVSYAKGKQKVYYHNGVMHLQANKNFYDPKFKPFLDSIGVSKEDLVISMPDPTPDVSLYLIGRRGWTDYNILRDTVIFNKCVGWGAKYLILNDPILTIDKALSNYTGNLVAHYGNILIYKLGDKNQRPGKQSMRLIKTMANAYLTDDQEDIKNVFATTDPANAKMFTLIPVGKDSIVVKTDEGKFLSCNVNGGAQLTASTPWIGDWEKFKLVELPEGKCALKAINGKYLSVQNSEPHRIIATSETIGQNEIFKFSY